jgi:simple sugar transport system ATP-binding protein
VNHAYPVADSFTLAESRHVASAPTRRRISKEEVLDMMAGGAEMKTLMQGLEGVTI